MIGVVSIVRHMKNGIPKGKVLRGIPKQPNRYTILIMWCRTAVTTVAVVTPPMTQPIMRGSSWRRCGVASHKPSLSMHSSASCSEPACCAAAMHAAAHTEATATVAPIAPITIWRIDVKQNNLFTWHPCDVRTPSNLRPLLSISKASATPAPNPRERLHLQALTLSPLLFPAPSLPPSLLPSLPPSFLFPIFKTLRTVCDAPSRPLSPGPARRRWRSRPRTGPGPSRRRPAYCSVRCVQSRDHVARS